MTKAVWKTNAEKYAAYRDASMAEIEKYFPSPVNSRHLGKLPVPLPLNVIPLKTEFLAPEDLEIVETDPIELLEHIKQKKYSAVRVAGAYIRTAVLAQRLINNVTEFLSKEAFEQATYLDEYLEQNGTVVGPLHGLPVSLKDHIALEGKRNTFMLTSLIDNVVDYNSTIVDIVKDAGAVFYQRTTQPQFLMHFESNSPLHGITANPFNTSLTCGGSSGGEGAAVGFGSSCVGLGTDIGGSVRGPASMQGVYGMKGSVGRLPADVYSPFSQGAESIHVTVGPFGRTRDICELIFKVVLDAKPWIRRPELAPMPWKPNDVLKNKTKIKVGIMYSDGFVTPQPPMARAIREVESKLKASTDSNIEVEVVPFKPYDHEQSWHLIHKLFFEDGGKQQVAELEKTGEPLMVLSKYSITENPDVKAHSLESLWKVNGEKHSYRNIYNKHWNESGIDFLICPASPGAAQPHGTSFYYGYTSHWNLLDYPAISFPVTTVDPEKDVAYEPEFEPVSELDKKFFERYSVEKYANAPISLQLITRRLHEEDTFEYLKFVEKILAK